MNEPNGNGQGPHADHPDAWEVGELLASWFEPRGWQWGLRLDVVDLSAWSAEVRVKPDKDKSPDGDWVMFLATGHATPDCAAAAALDKAHDWLHEYEQEPGT